MIKLRKIIENQWYKIGETIEFRDWDQVHSEFMQSYSNGMCCDSEHCGRGCMESSWGVICDCIVECAEVSLSEAGWEIIK